MTTDTAPTARTNKVLEKDLDARRRAALNEESTHLRVGDWQGLHGDRVKLVGHARDLHGTVCTCCPKQKGAASLEVDIAVRLELPVRPVEDWCRAMPATEARA